MTAHLDNLYLEWLYSQVASVKQRAKTKTYWSLLRQLYSTEFVWLVPNDDNRVADGRDLRWEFIEECNIQNAEASWMRLGCSMLELIIGLSRRLEFEDDTSAKIWFWTLIKNLELDQCTDAKYRDDPRIEPWVASVLDRVIFRTYDENGVGGLFPLKHAIHDQRKVELWYQLCAYLLENE